MELNFLKVKSSKVVLENGSIKYNLGEVIFVIAVETTTLHLFDWSLEMNGFIQNSITQKQVGL